MNKRILMLVSIAALAMSSVAHADCGGGNGNQDPPSNGCNGGQGGNGGNGGNGGDGGSVGPITITVDSANTNTNNVSNYSYNSNRNANQNFNHNTNSATGGNGGSATSSATGGTASATGGTSSSSSNSGGNTISVVNTDSGSLRYSGSYRVKSVPTAYTPNAYPTAPCIIGVSAGGSGVGFGVSFGAGKVDLACTRRENARRLTEQGEVAGATALMCQDKDIYRAMKRQCDIAIAAGK